MYQPSSSVHCTTQYTPHFTIHCSAVQSYCQRRCAIFPGTNCCVKIMFLCGSQHNGIVLASEAAFYVCFTIVVEINLSTLKVLNHDKIRPSENQLCYFILCSVRQNFPAQVHLLDGEAHTAMSQDGGVGDNPAGPAPKVLRSFGPGPIRLRHESLGPK